jgi:16S rRNA (guanine527-N7)-methyltransferase
MLPPDKAASTMVSAPASATALQQRLEALAAHIPLALPAGESDLLMRYLALLQRWNTTYNLTAVRDPAQMLTQHLIDCLAIVPALRRHAAGAPQRMLDVGSGGGLPGVVLAALNPAWDVTCVDSVGKKAAFVQQAAVELRLGNLHSQHSRVEQLKGLPFSLITSRAFASLPDFVMLTRMHLAPGGAWVAMKGKCPDSEIAALPSGVGVFHVEQLNVPELGAERCLVWMRPSL